MKKLSSNAVTIHVAGLAWIGEDGATSDTLTLTHTPRVKELSAAVLAAIAANGGKVPADGKATAHAWRAITDASTPLTFEDEAGEEVEIVEEGQRGVAYATRPRGKEGNPADLPNSLLVSVSAFDVEGQALALEKVTRPSRIMMRDGAPVMKDGHRVVITPEPLLTAQASFKRPNGSVYGLDIVITPSADGKGYRARAILAA
jgi:hypothetical protein